MKLIRQFEQQSRFAPEKMLSSGVESLALVDVRKIYDNFDDADAVAARVFENLDSDKNGFVSLLELSEQASSTDGKISLSALDPGKGESIPKRLWELCIVSLILYFCVSFITHLAKEKQSELDEKRLEQIEKIQQKKQ